MTAITDADRAVMDAVDAALLAADEARREILATMRRLERMHTLALCGQAPDSARSDAHVTMARMRAVMEALR